MYEQVGGNWFQRAKLSPPYPQEGARYGADVDVDGNTMVVGAWREDWEADEDCGRAYVFEGGGTNWSLVTNFYPTGYSIRQDAFGESVAIDGDCLLVGAHNDEDDADMTYCGSVYFYQRNAAGRWEWVPPKIQLENRQPYDLFGVRAAMGNGYVMVGAWNRDDCAYNAGAVLVYRIEETAPGNQAISDFIPTNGSVFMSTDAVGLSATASSGLDVLFTVGSGPGVIAGETNLTFTGVGVVAIIASQAGNENWNAASAVTNLYTVMGLAEVTIESAYGSAIPVTGVYTMLVGTVFTNQVQTPDQQGTTQYVCYGWIATENLDPAGGSGTQAVVTVNGAGTLTWQWNTEFYLTPDAGPNGSINQLAGWFTNGAIVGINATPAPYYHFTNWTGSVLSYDNPLNLLMDEAKWVTANFAESMTTNRPTPLWWLAQYGLTNNQEEAVGEDPDKDGIPTGDEWSMNTDPTNGTSYLYFAEMTFSDGGDTLGWPCATDRVYDVQHGLSLPPGAWMLVDGMTNLLPTHNCLVVTNPPDGGTLRFYRLRVRLPE